MGLDPKVRSPRSHAGGWVVQLGSRRVCWQECLLPAVPQLLAGQACFSRRHDVDAHEGNNSSQLPASSGGGMPEPLAAAAAAPPQATVKTYVGLMQGMAFDAYKPLYVASGLLSYNDTMSEQRRGVGGAAGGRRWGGSQPVMEGLLWGKQEEPR